MKKNGGDFIADGNAVDIDIGFIPDYFRALSKFEETNQITYEWWRSRSETNNQNGQFGLVRPSGGGSVVLAADADNGIQELDEANNQVSLPAVLGDGVQPADPPDPYTVQRSTDATARSTTALGTILKPSIGNETGYIYECTVAGTGSAEPTWPDAIGENVTDNSMVWQRVDVSLQRGGYQGVVIAAALSTNDQEWYYEATQADQSVDHQDTAGWTDGIDPDA